MRWMDTHCHFDAPDFDSDRAELITAMAQQGITDLILPATAYQHWGKVAVLSERYSQCHACFGLHPIYLTEHKPEHLMELTRWLQNKQPVAVGECGLDFYLPDLDPKQQEALFIAQIRLACEFDLPLIVHARRSLDAVLKCLRRFPSARGIIHSFAGSLQQAEQCIEQGFYLGVGGTVTYERAQKLRHVLITVPLNTLVLETDAPDQPDSQWRGKRNDPLRLPIIAQALADLRQEPLEHIAAITTHTAQTLFKLA